MFLQRLKGFIESCTINGPELFLEIGSILSSRPARHWRKCAMGSELLQRIREMDDRKSLRPRAEVDTFRRHCTCRKCGGDHRLAQCSTREAAPAISPSAELHTALAGNIPATSGLISWRRFVSCVEASPPDLAAPLWRQAQARAAEHLGRERPLRNLQIVAPDVAPDSF